MTKELNDRIELLEKRQKIDTNKLKHLMLFGIIIFVFSGVHNKFATVMRLLATLLWFVDCVQGIMIEVSVSDDKRGLDC